jgi:hypothetical protein
MDHVG